MPACSRINVHNMVEVERVTKIVQCRHLYGSKEMASPLTYALIPMAFLCSSICEDS